MPEHHAPSELVTTPALNRRVGGLRLPLAKEVGPADEALPPKTAILLPCLNEAATIAKVVADFRAALPLARIFVFDNGSTDSTREAARAAGAELRSEARRGKGNVVRRMFADVEADFYLLADGDDTYDASLAPLIVGRMAAEGLDFLNVARRSLSEAAFRPGHRFGNFVLSQAVQSIFGRDSADMLSGYKGFSRRYVKSFPATSSGFETETELTVHALELRMPMAEIDAPYRERPAGSASKLNTVRDGLRILTLIARLIKDERPRMTFVALGLVFMIAAALLGGPVVGEYLRTGLVPRLPTAVLASGLTGIGALGFVTGLILDVVTKARQETKRLAYLRVPRFEPDAEPAP